MTENLNLKETHGRDIFFGSYPGQWNQPVCEIYEWNKSKSDRLKDPELFIANVFQNARQFQYLEFSSHLLW